VCVSVRVCILCVCCDVAHDEVAHWEVESRLYHGETSS
jgi:hypothetical protein